MGRSVRLRRGADQPGDDTGPYAGQHAARAEQGKPGRDRAAASETVAGTAEPYPVGETGPLRAPGGDYRRARRSPRGGAARSDNQEREPGSRS